MAVNVEEGILEAAKQASLNIRTKGAPKLSPHTARTSTKAKPKNRTKEEAAALYPQFAVGTRVSLPFEFATDAGPSTWIWAAGEVTHLYRVTGEHQGFEIHVQWDPATPNDKKGRRTNKLWRYQNGSEMVPIQLCTPDIEHLTGTAYTGEVPQRMALATTREAEFKGARSPGYHRRLSPHKLRPLFQPKDQNFVIEKNSFFCHFEGTVFHTLPKNSFFIRIAHFWAVFREVKKILFGRNQRAFESFSPKKIILLVNSKNTNFGIF